MDEVRVRLQQAKLALREKAASSGSDTSLYCGVKCNVKELEDVLFRDVGDKIKSSGKGVIILTELGRYWVSHVSILDQYHLTGSDFFLFRNL